MNKEQKRYVWLIVGLSFFTGIGFMSVVNIIKTALNQHPLQYDWIMLTVSIIIIVVCLILYLTKSGIALEDKIRKYR
ncbi:MAG: hypothetical protein BV458_02700 [Thermoplasmata archaeon M9B2D]|nr:MAG: hypothetical protein BV458_02700 [Thermoplasmata archaeon M9B2D]